MQREIGSLFQTELKHFCRGNMVSVTIVRVTPDLSYARVYLSVFPEKKPSEIVDELNDRIHEVNAALHPRIRHQFRKMPEVKFFVDDSLDYAARIEELLSK